MGTTDDNDAGADERRREDRRPLVFKVEIEGQADAVCETQDISVGGAFLLTEHPPPIGVEVRADVSFPGFLAPCTRRGVVRWRRPAGDGHGGPPAGFGVEWTEAPVDDPLRRALGEMRDVAPVTRGARILVAEDNEHILSLVERTLPRSLEGEAEVRVVTAPDGERAWSHLLAGDIDLAILDIYMPGMDGLEVLRRLRAHKELATTPVIIISAAGPDLRQRAYADGADFFLDKPVRLLEIVDTVRTLLRLWPAAR